MIVNLFGRKVRFERLHGIAAGLFGLLGAGLLASSLLGSDPAGTPAPPPAGDRAPIVIPAEIPQAALDLLAYADAHEGRARPGYAGNRPFHDNGNGADLPDRDRAGRRITYREYDVRRLRKGVPRGAERVVLGSDGSAYYTRDHYKSFKRFR